MRCAVSPSIAPRRPADVDGRRGHRIRQRLGLAGLAAVLALTPALQALGQPQAQALPALGESVSQSLPVGAERRLGDQIMRDLRRDPSYLDDPLLQDHAQSLWLRLLQAARQRGDVSADIDAAFAWELFLVRDRAINAFALPGGYVGVHLGLIAITSSADELASVLAHELSHVTQRHIARGIGQAERQGAVGVAAMILGVLLASRMNNPDMAQAAIAGSQAAVLQGQLNFSRDMEREADRIGWGIFREAGFASPGMAAMFDRLDRSARLNDSGGLPYLRTHPLTSERLTEARSRAALDEAGAAVAPAVSGMPTFPTVHALMQARARALMDPSTVAWQRLLALSTSSPTGIRDPGATYAGTLAAIRLGEHARARAGLQWLWQAAGGASPGVDAQTSAPGAIVALLAVEAALARGDPQEAQSWIERADRYGSADPGRSVDLRRPRLLARAEVALFPSSAAAPSERAAADRLAQAGGALRAWVGEHPLDAAAWSMLARVEQSTGQPLRALRAAAEALALVGDLDGAIDRLRAAQAASQGASRPGDFIEASVIDARLRQLLAQRQRLAQESRGASSGSR